MFHKNTTFRAQKQKKGRPFDLPFQYPLRGSTALRQSQSCARILTPSHPPWQGGDSRVLATETNKNKKSDGKTIGSFVVPPQGLEPWTPTLRVSCSTN